MPGAFGYGVGQFLRMIPGLGQAIAENPFYSSVADAADWVVNPVGNLIDWGVNEGKAAEANQKYGAANGVNYTSADFNANNQWARDNGWQTGYTKDLAGRLAQSNAINPVPAQPASTGQTTTIPELINKSVMDMLPDVYNKVRVQQAEDRANAEYNALNDAGPARIAAMDAMRDRMLTELAKVQNPYAQDSMGRDNLGLQNLKSQMSGQIGNSLAGALRDQQEGNALRGIRTDSNLAQNQSLMARLAAGQQKSQQLTGLDAANYDKSADWQRWFSGFQQDALNAANNWNQSAFNNLMTQAKMRNDLAWAIPQNTQAYGLNAGQGMAQALNNYGAAQTMPSSIAYQTSANNLGAFANNEALGDGQYLNPRGLRDARRGAIMANAQMQQYAPWVQLGQMPLSAISYGATKAIAGGAGG